MRRISKVAGSVADDGDVTDESFRNPNLSMPADEIESSTMATLPNMKVKAVMQPKVMKIVN